MESTEARVAWLLALEDRPFLLNTHYLADYRDKFLAYYKGAREQDRNANLMSAIREYAPHNPMGITKVLAGLVEVGVKPEELAKLISPNRMEPALAIMADVRAYFQGALLLFLLFFIRLRARIRLVVYFVALCSRLQTFRGQCTARDRPRASTWHREECFVHLEHWSGHQWSGWIEDLQGIGPGKPHRGKSSRGIDEEVGQDEYCE